LALDNVKPIDAWAGGKTVVAAVVTIIAKQLVLERALLGCKR
jgi:hypothetical protein